MGNADLAITDKESQCRVPVPPARPFLDTFQANLKETFFPDDPFRQFKNERGSKRVLSTLQYFLPVLEWAPRYTLNLFKSDLIAGITIASLAIPQGISYAKLANLPPILGLCESLSFLFFVVHDIYILQLFCNFFFACAKYNVSSTIWRMQI
jgi:sulfate transporter 3